jgi:hypothetical protein
VSVTKRTHSTPKPVIKSTEKIPELQPEPEPPVVEEEVETTPTPKEERSETQKTNEQPPKVTPATEEEAPEKVEVVTEPEPSPEEEPPEEVWTIDSVALKDTNTLAMLVVGVILGLGIIGFVLFAIFDIGSATNNVPEEVPEQTLFMGATFKEVSLVNLNFNGLVSSVNSALIAEQPEQTIEYTFVDSQRRPVPATVVMRFLKTQISDGFADSITTVRFIHTATGERAILLRSSDQTTARGGMLNWEETLLADIGLLLDVQEVSPNAGTFVDTQLGTLDVRALLFNEATLLVYAVINETDVVIASDITALSEFAGN